MWNYWMYDRVEKRYTFIVSTSHVIRVQYCNRYLKLYRITIVALINNNKYYVYYNFATIVIGDTMITTDSAVATTV